jgi:plastocyanin
MSRLTPLSLACAVLALAAGGCGGGNDNKSSNNANTQTNAAPAAPTTSKAPAAGKTTEVTMKNIQFVPKNITVKAGTTIKWTNDDQVPHTVTTKGGPGGSFDSGQVAPGKTFETKVTKAGSIDYVCTIHPGQSGTIKVE